MKYTIVIFLIASSLFVQGQRNSITIFNDWGYCGPGPVIQEELILFPDGSFNYMNCHYPNFRIEASGYFLKKDKNITLVYDNIKMDTLNKSLIIKERPNIKLISEFHIVKDKEWLENKSGMLYECGKQFRSGIKLFEPGKRRIVTSKIIDY